MTRPGIALQSGIKNWQRSGSAGHRLLLEILTMKIRMTLIAAILFCVSLARADEAIFAWTYTTDLLPKGKWEFEQWMTARWEKEHGTYNVFDFREELEYGVTDNFQIALYLNHHYVNANDDVPVGDPLHPKRLLVVFTKPVARMSTRTTTQPSRSTAITSNQFLSKPFIGS